MTNQTIEALQAQLANRDAIIAGLVEAIKSPKVAQHIAEKLCACQWTDGFCSPGNKPDCNKCWPLAKSAHGLILETYPVWPAVNNAAAFAREKVKAEGVGK